MAANEELEITRETLVKQEPRVSIARKESVKGDVSWNIELSAPLSEDLAGLIDRIASARKHCLVKDAEIQRFWSEHEKANGGDYLK